MLPAEADSTFDRIANLTRRILDVPTALVTLVDRDRQAFPGAVGLPEPWQSRRQTPLSHSFCQYVVAEAEPLVVDDATTHPFLATNGAIADLGVLAYAGMPIRDRHGTVVGSLCAIDGVARVWTPLQLANLADLADACSTELKLRQVAQEATALATKLEHVVSAMPVGYLAYDAAWRITEVNDEALRLLRTERDGIVGHRVWDLFPRIVGTPVEAAMRRVGTTRRPETLEEYFAEPLDSWYEIRLVGDPPGVAAYFLDVTARHEDESLAQEILSAMPVGYARLDSQWRYEYVNDEAARLCGLDRADLIGQVQWELFPQAEESIIGVTQRRVVETGKSETVEAYYPAPLDTWYDLRFSSDGNGLSAYFVDVSAQHAMQDLLARQAEHDRSVAHTLQDILLTDLPAVDGVRLAARYLTATGTEHVGGDWYDAVVQPDATLTVSIGDVCGHDIGAAATMGQLRAMLRGFLWADTRTLAHTVTRLDRAAHGLGSDVLATLIIARIGRAGPAGTRTLHWTNAGHPAPVVLHADGTTEVLERRADLMLGFRPDRSRHDHVVELERGSTLLLYTDGLIETRERTLESGTQAVLSSLGCHRELGLEGLLDALVRDVGADGREDDVALLAIRID